MKRNNKKKTYNSRNSLYEQLYSKDDLSNKSKCSHSKSSTSSSDDSSDDSCDSYCPKAPTGATGATGLAGATGQIGANYIICRCTYYVILFTT